MNIASYGFGGKHRHAHGREDADMIFPSFTLPLPVALEVAVHLDLSMSTTRHEVLFPNARCLHLALHASIAARTASPLIGLSPRSLVTQWSTRWLKAHK
jgi:hypothetical protein